MAHGSPRAAGSPRALPTSGATPRGATTPGQRKSQPAMTHPLAGSSSRPPTGASRPATGRSGASTQLAAQLSMPLLQGRHPAGSPHAREAPPQGAFPTAEPDDIAAPPAPPRPPPSGSRAPSASGRPPLSQQPSQGPSRRSSRSQPPPSSPAVGVRKRPQPVPLGTDPLTRLAVSRSPSPASHHLGGRGPDGPTPQSEKAGRASKPSRTLPRAIHSAEATVRRAEDLEAPSPRLRGPRAHSLAPSPPAEGWSTPGEEAVQVAQRARQRSAEVAAAENAQAKDREASLLRMIDARSKTRGAL